MNYIEDIKERVKVPEITDVLTEDMVWQQHGPLIWQAERFDGQPSFYPVYKYEKFYSYSLLALIIKKRNLKISEVAVDEAKSKNFVVLNHGNQIDTEIERVGAKHGFSNEITDTDEYSKKIVDALKKDIVAIENKNPDYTNVIMCGGKDSLNLLLLPWKNPVTVVSAEPNYALVKKFVTENGLDIKVERLDDNHDDEYLTDEIAELCCRQDSRHWRWGHHIRKIARENSGNVVIWKGQLGDVYLSPRWKTYIFPETQPKLFFCKVYKKLSPYMPRFLSTMLGKYIVSEVEETLWHKSAVSQGAHMGFIRALSGSLVLSAYHGNNVRNVLSKVDLSKAVQTDVRPKIGELIHGGKVKYPSHNPSPKLSDTRIGAHCPDRFITQLEENGIVVSRE